MPLHIDQPGHSSASLQSSRQPVYTAYPEPNAGRRSEPSFPALTLTQILWRGKWIIAAAIVIGLLGGAVAIMLTKPVYRARTSLLLEGFNDQAIGSVNPVSPLPASAVDYIQNEVKVLESNSLARRVGQQLGPDVAVIARKPADQLTDQQQVKTVAKAITVRTGMQSQVMEVFFDAPDAGLAARGANAVTAELIKMSQEARSQMVQDTTQWLNRQASDLKAKLDGLNGRLQDFTAKSGLVLSSPQGTPVEDRARQLQDALTRAQADRAAKQARYEAVTAGPNETTEVVSAPLTQYQTDLQNMRRQLADLKTMYQPDNYRVTRLEAQVASTEAAIKNEQASIRDRMRNDYLAAASLEKMLTGSLNSQLSKVQEQTQRELEYNVLKNEVDTTQKLYDSVMEKAKDAGAESSLRITNFRVIDPAAPPSLPFSPNVLFDLSLGLGFGALGGAALVLLGTGARRVRDPGELTALAVPELGVVPSVPKELAEARAALTAHDTALIRPESSLLWESLRAVLISILFRTHENDSRPFKGAGPLGQVLVISSLEMMEGKTTVVTSLGIASAQHQRKVLLIDADLRRPCLHERFGVGNDRGFADVLLRSGEGEFDKPAPEVFITQTGIPNLSLLTAGNVDKDSVNLLYSPALPAVLQRLARHFDLIFIDTPPMAMYPEARVLGRISNGMVMVVRANTRSGEELQGVYQKLIEDRIPMLGTVLNHWKMGRSQARAYSRYYSHYQRT